MTAKLLTTLQAQVESVRAGTDTVDTAASRLVTVFNAQVSVLLPSLRWICSLTDPAASLRACKKLAGNPDAVKAGRSVIESTSYDTPGWGIVQFISIDTISRFKFGTQRKERVCSIRARALTGPPCPDVFTQIMSPRFLSYLARQIGFTRTKGKRPYYDDRELSGLRALAWFEAEGQGQPVMKKFGKQPSTLMNWNRSILNDRQRLNPAQWVCPRGYAPSTPCFQCTAGRDECRVAVRPKSLVQFTCAVCRIPFWTDPTVPVDRCIRCKPNSGGRNG